MRSWKKAEAPPERVYLYFRAHPAIYFTEDHVAGQVGVGRRRCRRIIANLVLWGKLEAVDTVSSPAWGRPKRMYRSVRATDDELRQREAFIRPLIGKPDIVVNDDRTTVEELFQQ